MNNTNLFIKICFLFMITSLYGCLQDEEGTINSPNTENYLTIDKAKKWYDANFNIQRQEMFRVKNDSASTSLELLLDWDKALIDNDSIWSVVELPWMYANGGVFMGNSETKYYAEANQVQMLQILRLVIIQNRESGKIYGFKMAVLPDLDYMLRKGENINANNYLNRTSDLSGAVMFYTLNDEFVNGWRYNAGKITAKLSPKTLNVPQKTFSETLRRMGFDYYVVETCYYYYVVANGVMGPLQFNGCKTDTYSVFRWDAEMGSDGGIYLEGGGGGSTTTTPNSGTSKSDLPDKKPKEEDIVINCNDAIQMIKNTLTANFNVFSQYGGYTFDTGKHLPSYQEYVNTVNSQNQWEHSMTFSYDSRSNMYFTGDITLFGNENGVYLNTSRNTIAGIHNHLNNTPPSPLDLKTLIEISYDNPNFKSFYTQTKNGTIYALEITDRTKLINFWNIYKDLMTIDEVTNGFKDETLFSKYWDNGKIHFKKLGDLMAWEYTIAYLLDKYDMGIGFSKKGSADTGFTIQYLQKDAATGKYRLVQCK